MNTQPFLIFFFFFCLSAKGQTPLSYTEYIESALSEPAINIHEKKVEFMQQEAFGLPVLDELEFRTETDEFDWKRQEYTIRAGFNNKKQRQYQNNVHQSNMDLVSSERLLTLHDAVIDRYEEGVAYYFLTAKKSLLRQQEIVVQDKIRVLQKLAQASSDFNLNEYIKTEDEAHQLAQITLQLEHDLVLVQQKIQFHAQHNNLIGLDTSTFIDITDVLQKIENLPDSCGLHPALRERQSRIQQHFTEFKLEENEGKKILDYAQLKYSNRKNTDLYKEFSVGVGLNIPLKKANQIQLNEIQLEQLDDDIKLTNLIYYFNQEIQEEKRKSSLIWAQYQLLQQQYAGSQALYSSQSYDQLGSTNPLALLQIEASLLRRQLLALDLKEQLYQSYVDLLDLTGVASQVPLQNWLKN